MSRPALDEKELMKALVYRCVVGDESITHVAEALGISRTTAHAILRKARETSFYSVNFRLEDNDELGQLVREEWKQFGVTHVDVLASPLLDLAPPTSGYRVWASFEQRRVLESHFGFRVVRHIKELSLGSKKGGSNEHLCIDDHPIILPFIRPLVGYLFEKFHHGDYEGVGLTIRPLSVHRRGVAAEVSDVALAVTRLTHALTRILWPVIPPGPLSEEFLDRPEIRSSFGENLKRPLACILSVDPIWYEAPDENNQTRRASDAVVHYAQQLNYLRAMKDTKHPERVFEPIDEPLRAEAYKQFLKHRVVGTLCSFGLKGDGTVVPGLLDHAGLATPPERIRSWREQGTAVIAVAAGWYNALALRAALRTSAISTLVIDTELALQLIPKEKTPPTFKSIPKLPESPG